jgi:hypothetical protein
LQGTAAEAADLQERPSVSGIEEKSSEVLSLHGQQKMEKFSSHQDKRLEVPGLQGESQLEKLPNFQRVSMESSLMDGHEDASLHNVSLKEKTFRYCDMHVELDNGTFDEDFRICR